MINQGIETVSHREYHASPLAPIMKILIVPAWIIYQVAFYTVLAINAPNEIVPRTKSFLESILKRNI